MFRYSFCILALSVLLFVSGEVSAVEKIVLVHELNGDADIWVMNPDGSNPMPLYAQPGSMEYGPVVSRNGTRIAFIRATDGNWQHGELWVMNSDGSNAVQITHVQDIGGFVGYCRPTWFPGDTAIAYAGNFSTSENIIYSVHPDGTGNRVLIDHVNDKDYDPSVSPNGRYVAAVFDRGNWCPTAETRVYDLMTGAYTTVVDSTVNACRGGFAWHPDGNNLALSWDSNAQTPTNIWTVHPDGSGRTQRTFATGAESYGDPWYSPDGSQIVCDYTTQSGAQVSIVVMNSNGSNLHALYAPSEGKAYQPCWGDIETPEPLQEKIVFVYEENGDADIWIMNPDGSYPTALYVQSSTSEEFPAISPTGQLIAFMRRTWDPRHDELWVMDADGSNAHLVLDINGLGTQYGFGYTRLTWFPEDSLIAFSVTFSTSEDKIYAVRPDGSGLRILIDYPGSKDCDPAVNPTDANVLLAEGGPNWTPSRDTRIYDLTDNSYTTIVSGSLNRTRDNWCWKPDGTRLACSQSMGAGGYNAPWNIWTINPDGSDWMQLTFATSSTEYYRGLNWSPDGASIVCDYTTQSGAQVSIVVMNAVDGSNLHAIYTPPAGTAYQPCWGRVVGSPNSITTCEPRPRAFGVLQNYPNPFNPSTTFTWTMTRTANAKLALFDVLGRQVAMLFDGRCDAGEHQSTLDGSHLSNGVYFARLEAAGQAIATRKVMLLK